MYHGLRLCHVWCGCRVCVRVEARSRVTQVGCVAAFFLWESDALLRCHRNTAVRTTVPGVVAACHPILPLQIVHMHVVQPDVVQILAADNKKPVRGYG